MSNLVVVGTQWGDEGKGKIVDLLTEQADVVVRFAGGNNAGHTLVAEGRRVVLHMIPSGILHPGTYVVLGDGMVVDPEGLIEEIDELAGLPVTLAPDNLLISAKAHMILPYHRTLDELREGTAGALGTTRRGVGPAYEDKAGRRGLRVGDLLKPERLERRLAAALVAANARIRALGGEPLETEPLYTRLRELSRRLGPHIADTTLFLHQAAAQGKRLLLEGAQGALLDLDHGSYPFVTSSTTLAGGVCAGAGIPPSQVHRVIGVAKAYVTRVGEGPFPTELEGQQGEVLRAAGKEYGATTGRPRRCGWLDLPALRYAARVSGVQGLALTKLDVLSGINPLRICVGYRLDGRTLDQFPVDPEDLDQVEPVLVETEGFTGDLSQADRFDHLPAAAREYVQVVERDTGLPVHWVSVGPGREQTLAKVPLGL
jgi:adenylosuccinate synthase